MKTIKKITRNYADYGFRITFLKVLSGSFSFIFQKKIYRLYKINLENYNTSFQKHAAFDITIMDRNNINMSFIKKIEEMEEWIDESYFLNNLTGDGICIVLSENNDIVGFNWIIFNDIYIPLIDKHRHLKKHQAWSLQITVNKEYRGKGIATILRQIAFCELKKRSVRFFYGGTLHNNISNIKLSEKVGFKFFIDVHYHKLLGKPRWKYKRVKANYA